jgi:hypothetical protein
MFAAMNIRLQHKFLDQLHNCLKACIVGFVIANTVFYFGKCNDVGWCFFFMAQQPLVRQGLLIVEASQTHSDTPHIP